MTYVALLRGINVGGNNKIEMKKLKATFEALGYTDVVTYINSGNIIFDSPEKNVQKLITAIEAAITQDFGLVIKVLIRSFEQIAALHQVIPDNWQHNTAMRTDVMFLWEEYDTPKVIEQLALKSVDTVQYHSGALVWHIKSNDYNHSAMVKIIGTKLYKYMTIRNVNTFRKLYELMKNRR